MDAKEILATIGKENLLSQRGIFGGIYIGLNILLFIGFSGILSTQQMMDSWTIVFFSIVSGIILAHLLYESLVNITRIIMDRVAVYGYQRASHKQSGYCKVEHYEDLRKIRRDLLRSKGKASEREVSRVSEMERLRRTTTYILTSSIGVLVISGILLILQRFKWSDSFGDAPCLLTILNVPIFVFAFLANMMRSLSYGRKMHDIVLLGELSKEKKEDDDCS